MTIFAYKVEETDAGLAIEKVVIKKGTELEAGICALIDKAVHTVEQTIAKVANDGLEISGHHIDQTLKNWTNQVGIKDLKTLLHEHGIETYKP